MIEFLVPDMTCGHCVSAITKAVSQADAGAKVDIDLTAHTVRIETDLAVNVIEDSIREAGYSPETK